MDEDIDWLVVIGSVEHELLLQIQKSSLRRHDIFD